MKDEFLEFKISGTFTSLLISFLIFNMVFSSCQRNKEELKWWKGNMHTHTFWSDGNDFPESVAKWYKENGYDFLVFTDHNIIHKGEKWKRVPKNLEALNKYMVLSGNQVEIRPDEEDGYVQVRLKTLEEYRSLFEEQDNFMLMMGNEISSRFAVHVLAFHQDEIIPVAEGTEMSERGAMINEVVSRVDEYRKRTARNTYPVLAHPNFNWAITAEMMVEAENLRFFEVYNGHPKVNNEGDEIRAGTERIWDIVLTNRLIGGKGTLLYGLATDDAHNYYSAGATPGKGWVMVRAAKLTPEDILDAIDQGDFYSSTGVSIKNIKYNGKKISIEIEPQKGVEYLTEYIGTLSGLSTASKPTIDGDGNEIPNTTRNYSEDIGRVLYSSNNLHSDYTLSGEELYVRVRITSNADQVDKITGEKLGKQRAWMQPVVLGH